MILHYIVDGDSLERLAEELLGSRERALEIFAANRDVLEDPEILPLGKPLRIPAELRTAGPETHVDSPAAKTREVRKEPLPEHGDAPNALVPLNLRELLLLRARELETPAG